jgi:hypothetical protein
MDDVVSQKTCQLQQTTFNAFGGKAGRIRLAAIYLYFISGSSHQKNFKQ